MASKLYQTARSLTSRFYETEYDLQQMQALLMEARSTTDDWHYAHVGELLFGFFMELDLLTNSWVSGAVKN